MDETLRALVAWVESQGGSCSLRFSAAPDATHGAGAYAVDALEARQPVLRVPLSCTMSVASALAAGDAMAAALAEAELPPDEALALHLLHQQAQGEASFWHPYLAALPATYDTPIFWSEEELSLLEGTTVLQLTRAMRQQLQTDWTDMHVPLLTRLLDEFPSGSIPSFEQYCWALTSIWTRAFGVTMPDGEYRRVMLPLVDLTNHSVRLAATGVGPEHLVSLGEAGEMIAFSTAEAVGPGEPVFSSYGAYSNAKLLYSYGFVDAENPLRGVDYWFNVGASDPLGALKRGALQNNPLTAGGQTYDFEGTLRAGGEVDPRLLATLRVILLNQEELPRIASAFSAEETVSERNEEAVWSSLRSACAARLGRFATTREQDAALLSAGGLGPREAAAVRVRMEDKEVLEAVVAQAAQQG